MNGKFEKYGFYIFEKQEERLNKQITEDIIRDIKRQLQAKLNIGQGEVNYINSRYSKPRNDGNLEWLHRHMSIAQSEKLKNGDYSDYTDEETNALIDLLEKHRYIYEQRINFIDELLNEYAETLVERREKRWAQKQNTGRDHFTQQENTKYGKPLELMADYLLGYDLSGSDEYLRKRNKDSGRKINVITEADLIRENEDGEEISPLSTYLVYDTPFEEEEEAEREAFRDNLNDEYKQIYDILVRYNPCAKKSDPNRTRKSEATTGVISKEMGLTEKQARYRREKLIKMAKEEDLKNKSA